MRERERTSLFWKIPKETMMEIVKSSSSIAEIIRKCEMVSSGASYKILKRRLDEEQIDYSHIKLGLGSNKGRKFQSEKIPLSQVMVKNSTYNRCNLKRRLLIELGWENKCSKCGNNGEWHGEPLTIQLDHINGISNDNRIENLRLLCPNCHSQTHTHSGKRFVKHLCILCDKKVSKSSKYCAGCYVSHIHKQQVMKMRKVERPEMDLLLNEIKVNGYNATGRKYGVTGNTIKKWIK